MPRVLIVKHVGWTYDNGHVTLTRIDGSTTRYSIESVRYTLKNLRFNLNDKPESSDFWLKMIKEMEKGQELWENSQNKPKMRKISIKR